MIEGPYGYNYNPAPQQERFDPNRHLEQMAMKQRNMLGHEAIGTEAMKESNISLNLERLDKILSQQEELVTLLEQKLTPFIRPYPKQMREEINQTAAPQSALAERLYHQTVRSDFLCGRINALIGSIDL
jgi:hypothetical protein